MVPETVNIAESHIIFFTKPVKPQVRRIVVHGATVGLDENSVAVDPLVSELEAFLVLLGFVGFQQIKHKLRIFPASL